MIKTYTFEGTFQWAFVQNKSPKYDNYSLWFYPKDDETRRAVKATGIRNAVKESEHGWYYQLRSDTPPMVVDSNGDPVTVPIGDGTKGRVQLSVEEFTSPKWGKLTRGKLVGVIVDELVPYEKKETSDDLPK